MSFFKESGKLAQKVAKNTFMGVTELGVLPLALTMTGLFGNKSMDPDLSNLTIDQKDKHKLPVILIHGCSFNQSQWVLYRMWLNSIGYHLVYSLNMDEHLLDARGNIETYTDKVSEKILKVLSDLQRFNHQYKQVILVGHSLGGIVGANCAIRYPDKVKGLITLNSPWYGADILETVEKFSDKSKGKIPMKEIHIEMKVDSKKLDGIRKEIHRLVGDGDLKVYNIGSDTDFMVPCDNAILIEENALRLQWTGHYCVLLNVNAHKRTREWLDAICN